MSEFSTRTTEIRCHLGQISLNERLALWYCCMMSLLLIILTISEIMSLLNDANYNQVSFFQASCIHNAHGCCPHHHPEKLFVQLGSQQVVTSDQKYLWVQGKKETTNYIDQFPGQAK